MVIKLDVNVDDDSVEITPPPRPMEETKQK